jgi:hypothetical protein
MSNIRAHRIRSGAKLFDPFLMPVVLSPARHLAPGEGSGGAGRDRTDDLMLAKHALSQLSYSPEKANSE